MVNSLMTFYKSSFFLTGKTNTVTFTNEKVEKKLNNTQVLLNFLHTSLLEKKFHQEFPTRGGSGMLGCITRDCCGLPRTTRLINYIKGKCSLYSEQYDIKMRLELSNHKMMF